MSQSSPWPPKLFIWPPIFHFNPKICQPGLISINKRSHDSHLENPLGHPDVLIIWFSKILITNSIHVKTRNIYLNISVIICEQRHNTKQSAVIAYKISSNYYICKHTSKYRHNLSLNYTYLIKMKQKATLSRSSIFIRKQECHRMW